MRKTLKISDCWKDVPNFEGLYRVSTKGEVFSYKTQICLSPKVDKNGYHEVGLMKDGNRKYMRVHRIVAQTFLGNPDKKPQVNHIDGNPANNHISNLEWNTPSENQTHRVKTLKRGVKPVAQYTIDGIFVAKYFSMKEAQDKTGIHKSGIRECKIGNYKQYRNFIWK